MQKLKVEFTKNGIFFTHLRNCSRVLLSFTDVKNSPQQKCILGKYSDVKTKTVEKHIICVHTARVVSTQCRKTQQFSLSRYGNMDTTCSAKMSTGASETGATFMPALAKLRVREIADVDAGLRFRWSLLQTHSVAGDIPK